MITPVHVMRASVAKMQSIHKPQRCSGISAMDATHTAVMVCSVAMYATFGFPCECAAQIKLVKFATLGAAVTSATAKLSSVGPMPSTPVNVFFTTTPRVPPSIAPRKKGRKAQLRISLMYAGRDMGGKWRG